MITAIELVRPTQAKLVLSGKLRYLIAILAVGVILLFIAVSAAEAIESRRRGAPYPNGAARAWGDTGTGTNASDVAGGVGRLFGAGPLPSPRSGRKWQADANSRMTPRNPAQPRGGDRP